MQFDFVPHLNSGVPSKVMKDLLNEVEALKSFGTPGLREEQFELINKKKSASYSSKMRALVAKELAAQHPEPSEKEQRLLQLFEQGASTVCTGHQLMVCGGTAFFEVKILSTIALARTLSTQLNTEVVPVFWMATEDHDFEEIASFQVNGRRFTWKHEQTGGPVGRLETSGLATQLEDFLKNTRLTSLQQEFLQNRLRAYKSTSTLAEATRMMVREWAADLGILVVDGDSRALKSASEHLWNLEMSGSLSELIQRQSAALNDSGYSSQVYPRPINLFKIDNNSRTRITEKVDGLEAFEISPNALLRPVYQETVLPNLAYVGGGGELAYWLQLGQVFDHLELPMPLLYLRDSLLCLTEKTSRNMSQQHLTPQSLLNSTREIQLKKAVGYFNELTQETEALSQPLEKAVKHWGKAMEERYPEMKQHVEALHKKISNLSRKTIEQRYRISKDRNETSVSRIHAIFDQLYPQGSFWERKASYADVLGCLGEDPQAQLVDKMSTIITGTHVLRPSK